MSEETRIAVNGNQLPPSVDQPIAPPSPDAPETSTPTDPRENGAPFYNRQWQQSNAADLRNSLLAKLPEGELPVLPLVPIADDTSSVSIADHAPSALIADDLPFILAGDAPGEKTYKSPDNLPNNAPLNYQSNSIKTTNQNSSPQQIVNQTLDDLINTAKEHKNFAEFRNAPKEFWNKLRQMSDVRVVEKYVSGDFEPRATSRYGELLERFTRQGGSLDVFLKTLAPAEREVFEARYLLNQTFGADELFVGGGIRLEQNGRFAVRELLLNNGKQSDLPLNTLLGLLGSDSFAETTTALFTENRLLFNSKTAALISLSLALYQNVNATVALPENAPPAFAQDFLGKTSENGGMRFVENNLDNTRASAERRTVETPLAAALINGAFSAINEKVGFSADRNERRTTDEINFGKAFSAGAMGAMFGAVAGCIVPLAETNVGAALGFAASVVVGTSERGLRYLSANLIISDVITSGVQTFLSAAARVAPPEKSEQNSLKQRLFNERTMAYLTS